MTVDQHNAVRSFKRRPGWANIYSGRFFAVLAHHWQKFLMSGFGVKQANFSNPLGVGLWSASIFPAMFLLTGTNTAIDISLGHRVSIN